ncbi:MAG: aromatic amino acid ammonia-lyase [Kangiellaceae bacterium]|jgi:histidine ammonia-lyase|nr:aromatic amino acid ammonia-lyase [Kangiellaceae bacterium]
MSENAKLSKYCSEDTLNYQSGEQSFNSNDHAPLLIEQRYLNLETVSNFLSTGQKVEVEDEEKISEFLQRSIDTLQKNIDAGEYIYGVNTLFGGLANEIVAPDGELQEYLVASHNVAMGEAVEAHDVKLAMLLRCKSLLMGVSAIRFEVIARYLTLINNNWIPHVGKLCSIGASGDLIPLAAIAGAAIGQSDEFSLTVNGELLPAKSFLQQQGLPSIKLQPKEGLALINGTSCHTAIAVNNSIQFKTLFDHYFSVITLICEVLKADPQPFAQFISEKRPHPGQLWVSQAIRESLMDSKLTIKKGQHNDQIKRHDLVQDKYAIRCIPQFLAPIVEAFWHTNRSLNVEMNAVSDNPIFDNETGDFFFGGNFLGQHVATSMDQMRSNICLIVKHCEALIAQLVDPTANKGLPASLAQLNGENKSLGVKPLQILGNAIAPLIEQKAAPLSIHFPIYAEQGNQNLNSQAFGSSNLTRESLELFNQHLSVTTLIALNALACRLELNKAHYDQLLSTNSKILVARLLSYLELNDVSQTIKLSTQLTYKKTLAKLECEIGKNSNNIDSGGSVSLSYTE